MWASLSTACVLAGGGQVVRDDERDLEAPPDSPSLAQDVVDGAPDLLVGDEIEVVEDADRVGELVDLGGVLVHALCHLEPLGLDLAQGLGGGQAGEEVASCCIA